MEEKDAYQINLEADLYLLGDEEVKRIIQNQSCVKNMNDILFELYRDSITEEFLQQLMDGTFDSNLVKGVMKND